MLPAPRHTGSGSILLGVLVGVALLGLVLWFLLRRGRADRSGQGGVAAIEAWTEAACPICLALAALEERRAALCVPPMVKRTTTLAPSATISSTVVCRG